jgi:predicted AlkP superfamily pyrophosphatase or phosphodiesterase
MNKKSPVILFSIDGLRPDGLRQAETPHLDRLMATGAYSLTARTVMPSVTLPCHVSLFLGVLPGRHGITTNTWTPPVRPVPGLIDEIFNAGLKTAAFFNWEELRDLARPGKLSASFYLNNSNLADGSGDTELTQLALGWLPQNLPDFTFIYLGDTDAAGHEFGWMTEPYFQCIQNADQCIGEILKVIPKNATIILTSDHGGHDQHHGTDSDDDMRIPILLNGPGIPANYEIQIPLQITDIAPTILRHFGLPIPAEWVGRPIDCV